MSKIKFPIVVHDEDELEKLYLPILYRQYGENVSNYIYEDRFISEDIGNNGQITDEELEFVGRKYYEMLLDTGDFRLAAGRAIEDLREKRGIDGN